MINLSQIGQKIVEVLRASTELNSAGVTVERGEVVNEDPDATPWIGIYRERSRIESRTLGAGSSRWRVLPSFILILQEADWSSGAECEEKLDYLIRHTLEAISAEQDLRGMVAFTSDLEVDYFYKIDEQEGIHYQWAKITIRSENRSR